MNPENNSNTSELHWQAFRYLAEEMSAEERSAFEMSLEQNLAACEALAQTVELTSALKLVEQFSPADLQPAPRVALAWNSRWAWVSAGLLAAVLVISAVQFYPASPESSPTTDPQLAAVWSNTQSSWEGNLLETAGDVVGESVLSGVAEDSPVTISSDLPAAPSWMLAAVRGLHEKKQEYDPIMAPSFGNETQEN